MVTPRSTYANGGTGERISLLTSMGGAVWPRGGRGDGGRNSGLGVPAGRHAGARETRRERIFAMHRGRNGRSDSPDREPGSATVQGVGRREFLGKTDG